MRILMRNTVFKTAVLAGLFLCALVLAGVFSGTPAEAQGFEDLPGSDIEPAITAGEVGTDEDRLKEFVEAAVDAYYVEFLIRRHCDFWEPVGPRDRVALTELLESLPYGISDLTPQSIETLTTEQIKRLIPTLTFALQQVDPDADPWVGCDIDSTSLFHQALRSEEGPWREDSVYLFIMDYEGETLFHGIDQSFEGKKSVPIDEGGRDVTHEIIDEVRNPDEGGFVEYCWDDPDVEGDEIRDSNGDPIEGKAPGDSWKISYVVDPFEYLGLTPFPDSPGVIFISGIYPKEGNPPEGCRIVTDMEEVDGDGDDTPVDVIKDAADAGGCAVAGSDSKSQSTAFNLLLTVFSLFLAVPRRDRATGKRNGVRS